MSLKRSSKHLTFDDLWLPCFDTKIGVYKKNLFIRNKLQKNHSYLMLDIWLGRPISQIMTN